MTTRAPVEFKVVAGTSGAGAGFILSQFILWLLGCWAWGASWAADKAVDAIAAVPQPAAEMIGLVVTVIGAYVFGWLAPHTHRPVESGASADPGPVARQGTFRPSRGGYSSGPPREGPLPPVSAAPPGGAEPAPPDVKSVIMDHGIDLLTEPLPEV